MKAEHQSSSGVKRADQEVDEKVSYTYTVHAMGPAATNPAIFQKLLSYNSTWALIDRGPPQAYIPIWELLRDLGSDYEEAAQLLEETWHEEEQKKRETSEKLKKFNEKRKKVEDVRVQLKERKKEYMERVSIPCDFITLVIIFTEHTRFEVHYYVNQVLNFFFDFFSFIRDQKQVTVIGHQTANSSTLPSSYSEEQAYNKAIELVMKDPHLNICEVYLRDESKKIYTLKCLKASQKDPMKFGQSKGYHVLFYSEIAFHWRNQVPVKEKCDD